MPTDKKVSVGWQIVFTFLPIVNFWAYYRIKRLRRYLLYIIVPQLIITTFYSVYLFSNTYNEFVFDGIADNRAYAADSNYVKTQFNDYDIFGQTTPEYWQVFLPFQLASWGFQGFSIYLVIVWSRQHNRKYSQPAMHQSG